MVVVYSATEGLGAMTLAIDHYRGWLDYEERVYHPGRSTIFDTVDALDRVLEHPSARFLRELTIGTRAHDDTYGRAAQVIARHRRPTLRTLMLGDFGSLK